MVDKDVLLAKISAAKKHLTRLQTLPVGSFRFFSEDLNTQDIVLFNLQLAVQNCIDIASHIVSTQGLPVPGSTSEMFYCLEENGYIDRQLSEKMVKSVGLRNLIVREYGKLDLSRIYGILQDDIKDLDAYVKAVIQKFNL